MRWFGTKEIKVHISSILNSRALELKGKRVLDIPCGNGYSLKILKDLGVQAVGADLFPELNKVENTKVVYANMGQTLPFGDSEFDYILCQEGIEHVGNQDFVMSELSRVLKRQGRLILSTPNYSNIKSRLSYLLTESEAFGRIMPPNEVDSIWLGDQGRVYFGHVFLTGIFKLRLFGLISGLRLKKIHSSRVNYTSLLFFPLLYPLILVSSLKTYFRFKRKSKNSSTAQELLLHLLSIRVLLENHLILEFEKIEDAKLAVQKLLPDTSAHLMTT